MEKSRTTYFLGAFYGKSKKTDKPFTSLKLCNEFVNEDGKTSVNVTETFCNLTEAELKDLHFCDKVKINYSEPYINKENKMVSFINSVELLEKANISYSAVSEE